MDKVQNENIKERLEKDTEFLRTTNKQLREEISRLEELKVSRKNTISRFLEWLGVLKADQKESDKEKATIYSELEAKAKNMQSREKTKRIWRQRRKIIREFWKLIRWENNLNE